MIVYKFGGASVKDATNIRNVANIIKTNSSDPLLIVVSAMGKFTNRLEELVELYFSDHTKSLTFFHKIIAEHHKVAEELGIPDDIFFSAIDEIRASVEWLLEIEPEDSFNYVYDQVVSFGELISSKILSLYLLQEGIDANWLDVRDVIQTNDTYREAKVDWKTTEQNMQGKIMSKLDQGNIVVTQGFIASTNDNNTTTLGREGSDFTGAIFAYCLNARALYIWKNVDGVLTGDPTIFEQVSKIDRLSYTEAIEMTYYGAKVIHPKTIKPLQNKSIPLHVKSFLNPSAQGTIVSDQLVEKYPPVVVVEQDQALIHISTQDFSFVAEEHLKEIFKLISQFRIKVNLMRNTAISFSICVKLDQNKIDQLIEELQKDYQVIVDENLSLLTIRHFNKEIIESMKRGKVVLFEERLEKMIQMVVKEVPVMSMKH